MLLSPRVGRLAHARVSTNNLLPSCSHRCFRCRFSRLGVSKRTSARHKAPASADDQIDVRCPRDYVSELILYYLYKISSI